MNRLALVAASALVPLAVGPVGAETVRDAIASAYRTNPTLAAARARQDALGETVEQARAAGRLVASVDGAGGYDRLGYGKGVGGVASASLPIWAGGRVRTAIRAAEGDTAAGAEGVRDTTAGIVELVVKVYAGLLYDQQAVAITRADIDLLERQVAESRERFRLGNATRTDVARLEAQRAGAVATLAAAEATLASDMAGYRAVVGHDPGALDAGPPALPSLPGNIEEARRRALDANPLVRQSQRAADAADARIGQARANGTPFLSASAGYGRDLDIAAAPDRSFASAANAGLTLHVPILTGGLVSSQVRQASANRRAAEYDIETAGREAVRAGDAAWANLGGSRRQTEANEQSVSAAELALKGVRAEYAFGLRTTLDILVADESLRSAQLALARSRSDTLIAQAALLRATGRLDGDAFASAAATPGG